MLASCSRQFATAEEAALAYARTPEAQVELQAAKPRADGATLEPGENESGHKGVHVVRSCKTKPFQVHNGRKVYLGAYATASEADLAVARDSASTVPGAASPCPTITATKRAALSTPPPAKQPRLAAPPLQATVLWSQPWFGACLPDGTCLPDTNVSQTQASAWSAKYAATPASLPVSAATPSLPPVSTAALSDGHSSFETQLAKVKWELNIAAATSAEATISQANALMGFAWPSGTLRQQLDRLVAETTCAFSS